MLFVTGSGAPLPPSSSRTMAHRQVILIVARYNNICVGFDAYPANVSAAFVWTFVVFNMIRYVELDCVRMELNWVRVAVHCTSLDASH